MKKEVMIEEILGYISKHSTHKDILELLRKYIDLCDARDNLAGDIIRADSRFFKTPEEKRKENLKFLDD